MKFKLNAKAWTRITQKQRAFFLYAESILEERLQQIRHFLGTGSLYYSVKANPNQYIVQWLAERIDGFDVSSESEIEYLQNLNISPSRISFSGPGKTNRALERANQLALKAVHLDSLDEFLYCQQRKFQVPLTLRITAASDREQKLGFTIAELESILENYPYRFEGLHLYLGRESFHPETFKETIARCESFFLKYPQSFKEDPKIFLGPGIPQSQIPEAPLSMDSTICRESVSLEPVSLVPSPLILEMGRALVGPCGYYGAPVLARKVIDSGRTILIIEGGLQHLGSPLQNYRDPSLKISVRALRAGQTLQEDSTITVAIYGSLCLGHDCLLAQAEVPGSIDRGDWLIFSHCGAYGLTAGVPFFIGQSLPLEFFVSDTNEVIDITNSSFQTYLESSFQGTGDEKCGN